MVSTLLERPVGKLEHLNVKRIAQQFIVHYPEGVTCCHGVNDLLLFLDIVCGVSGRSWREESFGGLREQFRESLTPSNNARSKYVQSIFCESSGFVKAHNV